GLAAQAHAAGGGGLAVEDAHVDAPVVEPLEHRRRGRALDELDLGHVRRRAPADGQPDLLARVRLVAVDEHPHRGALRGGRAVRRSGGAGGVTHIGPSLTCRVAILRHTAVVTEPIALRPSTRQDATGDAIRATPGAAPEPPP